MSLDKPADLAWASLLLLLLSRFSSVRLCATPQTAAHQAPPSLGFSRQEHWSGLPFPSPVRESEVTQSSPTLSDLMDCSPPGSSIHGIFQARVLECGAIAFSNLALKVIQAHFPCGSVVNNLPEMQELQETGLIGEDPLEEGIATHSSILAWQIPWTEEPGGLQSMGSLGVGHD